MRLSPGRPGSCIRSAGAAVAVTHEVPTPLLSDVLSILTVSDLYPFDEANLMEDTVRQEDWGLGNQLQNQS